MADTHTPLARRLIRNIDDAPKKHWTRGELYESTVARLSAGTEAKKLSARVEIVPPGKRACPFHLHHAQEEMFIVLSGAGTLRVAGEMIPIKAGDVMFLPAGPDYPHQIINTSAGELKYLSIGTNEAPEICEYPDSKKFLAKGSLESAKPFEVIGRSGESLDYWAGEP